LLLTQNRLLKTQGSARAEPLTVLDSLILFSMNYFELFDIPVQFRPDKQMLRKKYLELSGRYHPDRYGSATGDEQEEVLELSAKVNKGYKTLTNDDELTRYILEEKGLLVTDEKYALAPDFLMEMMDLNETLPEAMEDEKAKSALVNRLKALKEEIYEPVKNIMENYQEGATSKEELLQIKDYYFRKKYLQRIAQQLGQKL
jgi:molecular chaperone HscB